MQKLIKTSNELIEHMKNKEIKFNIISEIEAKKFWKIIIIILN